MCARGHAPVDLAVGRDRHGAVPESDRLPTGFTLSRPGINLSDPDMEVPYTTR